MELKSGQIIVTQATHSIYSRLIQYFTKSKATHALLVVEDGTAIEASFPRVRKVQMVDVLANLNGGQDFAYAVLDYPGITDEQRHAIAVEADKYVGRRYDVAQVTLFALTGQFWNDGPLRLICSRLVTAAYELGAGLILYTPEVITKLYAKSFSRISNLRAGYATPADLLRSAMVVVYFYPSSTVQVVDDFFKSK